MTDFHPKIEDGIREHGQFVMNVLDSPPWSYTIGNCEQGFCELVIYGLDARSAHPILNAAGTRMRAGGKIFQIGSVLEEIASLPLRVDPVHETQIPVSLAQASYREERLGRNPSHLRALQLVWPDPNGFFPGDAGHDKRYCATQPLISAPYIGDIQGYA